MARPSRWSKWLEMTNLWIFLADRDFRRYVLDDDGNTDYGMPGWAERLEWRLHELPFFWDRPTGLQWLGWLGRAWCRLKGHPAGVWWFNPGGMAPDEHCKGCGADLG